MSASRPNAFFVIISLTLFAIFTFQNCSHLDEPTGSSSASSLGDPNDIEISSAMMDVAVYTGDTLHLDNIAQSRSGRPLTFSWTKNNQPLSFSTSTISLANVSPADAGMYLLTISNDLDRDVVSAQVTVSAVSVITITTQPQPLTLANGTAGTLSVIASLTGGTTLAYQWYKDNVAIAGATLASYSVAASGAARAGNYFVEVSAGLVTNKVKSNVVKVTATQSFNVNARNACVNGFCSCVTPNQIRVPYKPSADLICSVKGYSSATTFTTVNGPVGAVQCNANGADCFINANEGNIICSTVNCTN